MTTPPPSERGSRPATRLLRSATFRLAMLYAAIFGLSVSALLGFVYWASAGYMARQTDNTIEAEIDTLAERYRLTGVGGLAELVAENVRREPTGGPVYLLADPAGHLIAGNLDSWPRAAPDAAGWIDFSPDEVGADGAKTARLVRARTFVLPGRFRLLVGRDARGLVEIRALLMRAIGWGVPLTVVLALAGGVLVSRSTARRIDAITDTSRAIMAGDLGRRIETRGAGDDFDRLAEQLNRMLDRIEALMEDVRRVSDGIAHDLRTPLTRLRHRLDRVAAGEADAEAGIEGAIAEADRLLATFNALLRIARVESSAPGEEEDVDLETVASDVADLYAPLAESAGIALALDAAPVRARVDRHLIFQALANLVDNALKYTPTGGRVRVMTGREDARAWIGVEDTGPGIAAEARERVLERFHRLDASRTTEGNGLGLALVAAIARRHGARLVLGDANPGLSARIELPAERLRTPAPASRPAKPGDAERGAASSSTSASPPASASASA